MTLPVDDVIPKLMTALKESGTAVLQAPPGAGKTTRVPLAMLDAKSCLGRILMLEPRRLATRAAAQRMAQTLGESVGKTVGYRIRGEAKVSSSTRIEVVTEGILTRMIQSDPGLDGIGAVIFDEFHERSLNADLGLALALEVRETLRHDLILLAMSATLDAEPVAELMGNAPVITSIGQSFPVETQWLTKPLGPKVRFDIAMSDLIKTALNETIGGILAFLPGEGEIRRVMGHLGTPNGVDVLPLYGSMPFKDQQKALKPNGKRKLVLATAIAETSLTIPDIRVVVDGGRARRARFDPGSGMSRLVTERVTRAEATQRQGRAGRVAPGICLRLWTKGQEGALAAFPPAEIEAADLAGLALELAEWGSDALAFLTPPPDGALSEARALLQNLGALDQRNAITPHGRAIAEMPLHPRLAHMLVLGGKSAAPLAALLADRDPMRNSGVDLRNRLEALRNDRSPAFKRIRDEAKRLAARASNAKQTDPASQAALAYPDRIAMRRPGDDPRWLLSGGKGVKMEPSDSLAGQRFLVVTDTDGHPTEARIRTCLAITESALRDLFGEQIKEVSDAVWSRRDGRVTAKIEERFGQIALSSRNWQDAPADAISSAMLEGIRQLGLRHSPAAERLRARVALVRSAGHALPDMNNSVLLEALDNWLRPHLGKTRSSAEWKAFDTHPALSAMLDWGQTQLLNKEAPPKFTTPLDRQIPIDYSGEHPEITARLQELFGVTKHPMVAGKPLRVTLLSPGQKPVQTTLDLPGFWKSSYADVRKDMRGRYPKHPWPEDPTKADPTLRAKRRS